LAGTRTLDQCLKRALLYQLSYQPTRQRGINEDGSPIKRAAKINQRRPSAQAFLWIFWPSRATDLFHILPIMPLLKLNRINKGGEVYVNSEQIRFIEIESGSTTVNMGPGFVYAVQETPEAISNRLEEMESLRIRNAIQSSGLVTVKG
jgi:uncharacterized protein YlzI (FlbEa/FlbD family)